MSTEVKASVAYTMCSVLQKCLSFFTLPIFTRLLTTEQFGQYIIYSSWSGIIMIFLTLNLGYGSFSTAMVRFENRRNEYIASVQGICLLLSAVFLILYIPFSGLWNKLFDLPTSLVLVMVPEILAQTGIQLWSGKKRFEFKYKCVIAVTLAIAVLSPITAYLMIINTNDKGTARILGYSLVTAAVGGFIFISNILKGKSFYTKEFWKYALGFNLPLLAYYLSQVIFNQSDRIMIGHMCGESEAAMYGVAYNLAMVLTFVLNAINNSYVPWFYGKLKEGRQHENRKIACLIAGIMSLLLLAVIWYAPEMIYIMAGEQYMPAVDVVAPIAMSLLMLFYAQLFINVEFYYEEKKKLIIASIAAAVINILLNLLLIPVFGFTAAGYTTLLSYVIFVLSNYLAMKRVIRSHSVEDNAYSYKGLVAIAAGFTAASFLGIALYDYIIPRIVITALVIFIVLINAKRIVSAVKGETTNE